jgi:AcrR family transcriptional regulator
VTNLPLSRERILECAVVVADRDGLEAASLRRVAGELGVHVTSLYHHVATKEALLDGVLEELLIRADLPVGEVTWDHWVRQFVAGVSGVARDHPGAFPVLMRRPVQGARALVTFESGLAAFRCGGMDTAEAYAAVKAVTLAALGCCLEVAGAAASGGPLPQTDLGVLDPEDFPEVMEVSRVVDEVDVLGALTDTLVEGFRRRLAGRRR